MTNWITAAIANTVRNQFFSYITDYTEGSKLGEVIQTALNPPAAGETTINNPSLDASFILNEAIEIFEELADKGELHEKFILHTLNQLDNLKYKHVDRIHTFFDITGDENFTCDETTKNYLLAEILPLLRKELKPTSSIESFANDFFAPKDPLVEALQDSINNFYESEFSEDASNRLTIAIDTVTGQIDEYHLNVLRKDKLLGALAAARADLTEASINNLLNTIDACLRKTGFLSSLKGNKKSAQSLLYPFAQSFLTGSGLTGGSYSIPANVMLTVLETMITNLESQEGPSTPAIDTVKQAKTIIETALSGREQSPQIYQTAFREAWKLCTQFPILVGGIEIPVGLRTDEPIETNPVKKAQHLMQDFKENHSSYLNTRSISQRQIVNQIDLLSQNGACFAAHYLCRFALAFPENFPPFYQLIEASNHGQLDRRKANFLRVLGTAIDENISANVLVRWTVRLALPVVYWFSELFTKNLGGGLQHYFHEVVIPAVKVDKDKRLHSGPIAALRTTFSDLNRIAKDFGNDAEGSGSGLGEHIRLRKDEAIFNGGRTADDLYTEFANICIDEIMPKLTWSNQVHSLDQALNQWANNSDYMAWNVIRQILAFPIRIPIWLFEYLLVIPTQWVSQSLITWGAKKCLVDTELVKHFVGTIKTTQFEETPYVPVLDVIARWLMDIHQAQTNVYANAGEVASVSKSDEHNKQTIKEFLDRAFRFIEYWKTCSPQQVAKLANAPRGPVDRLVVAAVETASPYVLESLVELIELIQVLATEETQLERLLHDLCDIGNQAFSNAGREVTEESKAKRESEYQNTSNLIKELLGSVLWTVCLDITATSDQPGSVLAAKNHVTWLKETVGDKIEDWKGIIDKFSENPVENFKTFSTAYTEFFSLLEEIERKSVGLSAQKDTKGSKAGPATVNHLKEKTNHILNSMEPLTAEFHKLDRIYRYYTYESLSQNPAKRILELSAIALRDEDITDLLETFSLDYKNIDLPLELRRMMETLRVLQGENNGHRAALKKTLTSEVRLLQEELREAVAAFGNGSTGSMPISLAQRIGAIQQALTNAGNAIEETTYVQFLEIQVPDSAKAIAGLATSLGQQTLYDAMFSRAMALINLGSDPEILEMLLRNLAFRPFVEKFHGEISVTR